MQSPGLLLSKCLFQYASLLSVVAIDKMFNEFARSARNIPFNSDGASPFHNFTSSSCMFLTFVPDLYAPACIHPEVVIF